MDERFYFDELHQTGSVSQVLKSRPVRYALVFSVLSLGLSLFVMPQLSNPQSSINQMALNASGLAVDPVVTGSIKKSPKNEFILRRSVLDRPGAELCIIRRDGTTSGKC